MNKNSTLIQEAQNVGLIIIKKNTIMIISNGKDEAKSNITVHEEIQE